MHGDGKHGIIVIRAPAQCCVLLLKVHAYDKDKDERVIKYNTNKHFAHYVGPHSRTR